ncbi:MAG TPA: hypothetical protein VGP82_00745 [Ktedonobacterales bacterium]|jgi:general stress protein YciG|nr:hypothetical protein [Ktedonobacterales bacterium]
MTDKERHQGGGHVTLARHGREHFVSAGRKGSQALRDTYGLEHLAEMAKAGGAKTQEAYGHEHFVEAGRKGGRANRGRIRTNPSPLRGRSKVPRVSEATLSDLRVRIQASGLTQMDLAKRLGITQPLLSRLLQGQQHTCGALGGTEWPGRIAAVLQAIADNG